MRLASLSFPRACRNSLFAAFATTSLAVIAAPSPIDDVTHASANGIESVKPPSGPCTHVTATPVMVGDFLVYPMHERSSGECTTTSTHGRSLLAFDTRDRKLYKLLDGVSGEATLTHVPDRDRLYFNIVFGGTTRILRASTLDELVKTNVGATSDSSGVFHNGYYYFGTINTPESACQNPINKACGAVFGIDENGVVQQRRDVDGGLRAWMGTAYTEDGSHLYVGTAPQHHGTGPDNESIFRYGCNVLKMNASLEILANYDAGDSACHHSGAGGDDEDSVSGETALSPGAVWVYYHGANTTNASGRQMTTIARLDRNLNRLCSLELESGQIRSGGFYGGPTIDHEGNAFFPLNLPGNGTTSGGKRAVLLKVAPDCTTKEFASASGKSVYHSPTLVDDRYVLFAAGNVLQAFDYSGSLIAQATLASSAGVSGSPLMHDGDLYVVQEDGTINILRNTGLLGYGTAYWPRYRRDNDGSGSYSGSGASDFIAEEWHATDGSAYAVANDSSEAGQLATLSPAWSRSGVRYGVWSQRHSAPAGAQPVCKLIGAGGMASSAQVLSLDESLCAALRADTGSWIDRGTAFYAVPPVNGRCSGRLVTLHAWHDVRGNPSDWKYRLVTEREGAELRQLGWQTLGAAVCVAGAP